jgi:hypothetical protein
MITGFATTREVQSAVFRFKPAPGGSVGTPELTVDLTSSARQWFEDPASARFGSQFTLLQPFTLQGAANSIAGVSVTLSNSQGMSVPGDASRF